MIPPSNTTIDSIYGRIFLGRYNQAPETASGKKKTISVKDKAIGEAARKTIGATIKLWIWTKKYFMPTPSKFHYIFNMRDLSRIFQGAQPTLIAAKCWMCLAAWLSANISKLCKALLNTLGVHLPPREDLALFVGSKTGGKKKRAAAGKI